MLVSLGSLVQGVCTGLLQQCLVLQETLENVKYPCYAGSIQLKSQHRVVVLCQAYLSAVGTPQNFRNE